MESELLTHAGAAGASAATVGGALWKMLIGRLDRQRKEIDELRHQFHEHIGASSDIRERLAKLEANQERMLEALAHIAGRMDK